MGLTKLYQVVGVDRTPNTVFATKHSEEECVEYLNSDRFSDYMGSLTLTIRPIWTNANKKKIKEMVKE